jgi:transposase
VRTRSRSIHSSHGRHLQDLPCQGLSVRLRVKARRFGAKIHPVPERSLSSARPILPAPRLAKRTGCVRSFVARGSSRVVVCRVSSVKALGYRCQRRHCAPACETTVVSEREWRVRCLGVDEWAWRKGQQYGTILVALERHCVVDLLPERSAASLAKWLANNPTQRDQS